MSANLGTGGLGRRGLPLSAAAILAAAILTACTSKSSTSPNPVGTTTYQGTFAGGQGENGVITITVPTATSASLLSYSGLRANVSLASASSLVNVTGTLAFVSGGTINLTGTFDPSTGAFSLAGGGYTFTGTLSHANVSGTYTGPKGSGTWAALPAGASPPGAVVSGTYTGTIQGANTDGSGAFAGPIEFQFVQTGTAIGGSWSTSASNTPPTTGTISGAINGSGFTFTMIVTAPCAQEIVTGSGTITNGGATISASFSSAPIACSPKVASGTFVVNRAAPVAVVTVTPPTATVSSGGTVQLTAMLTDAAGNVLTGRVVSWASSNAAAATVSATGLVTGIAPGTATITATSEGTNGTAAITIAAASLGTWTTKDSMPTATSEPAPTAGVINGILYVVGGTSVTGTGTALTTLQAYDPVSNTWTTKASMSTGREGPAAGVINGVLYVAGGVGSGGIGHADAIAALEAYDPATDTWTTKAPMPTARAGGAAGVINGILFVVGGTSSSAIGGHTDLNNVEAYNPTTNTWATKAPMPTAGFGMASAVINGILYVAGSDAAPAAVEAYDPATDTWTVKASMLTGQAGAAAGVINGMLYVAGGFGTTGLTSASVEAYNPATNTWATKAPMPTARGVPAGGVVNGALYVAGGQTTTSNMTARKTVEGFTP